MSKFNVEVLNAVIDGVGRGNTVKLSKADAEKVEKLGYGKITGKSQDKAPAKTKAKAQSKTQSKPKATTKAKTQSKPKAKADKTDDKK